MNVPPDYNNISTAWPAFESMLLSWWDDDLRTSLEEDVRSDSSETLLYLPFPFSSAGGSEAAFPEMYAWDIYFVNLAMLTYGRESMVRDHILNQLYMIERYGFVLNGNRSFYLGRSQPPLHADMIIRYVNHTEDIDLARQAYPLLKREMLSYWCASHHMSSSGLHTNRDILNDINPDDKAVKQLPTIANLTEAMLAEAETGLDFCPNFAGEVRNYNPLITNCVLVRYLNVLAELAELLGDRSEIAKWKEMADKRSELIRHYCWDEDRGFFFDYCFTEKRMSSVYSLCGFLALWAGVATPNQASQVAENLSRFLQPFGLSQTDVELPSPYSLYTNVQWNYPAGWPPFQVLVPQALRAYGYGTEAEKCELAWLRGCMRQFQRTGKIYEKYNVVKGSLDLPKERQESIPSLHGWSSASCLIAGHNLF